MCNRIEKGNRPQRCYFITPNPLSISQKSPVDFPFGYFTAFEGGIFIKIQKKEEIIFKTTGEIFELKEGDELRITRKEQRKVIEENKRINKLNEETKQWNKELGGFVFVLFKYSDVLMKEVPELSPEDIVKLFYISTFVDYNGYLVDDGAFVKRSNMQYMLDITINPFDVFFNKVKNLGIIIQDDNKNIIMNKSYFSKGEIDSEIEDNIGYSRLYINTIQYLYRHVPQRKHKKLGMYFKLVPYMHRQQCALCLNPNDNFKNIKLMTLADLKDILGYNKKSIKPFIQDLLNTKLDTGESILGFFVKDINFWKSNIIINPKVFYGGNFDLNDGTKGLLKYFY